MRFLKTPVLLTVAAATTAATAFVASPATAAAECEITDVPTTVVIGTGTTLNSLVPTTDCPEGSPVEFSFTAGWPEGVPYNWQGDSASMVTYVGAARPLHREDGQYPFEIRPVAGNIAAGQPFRASWSAFVDTGRENWKDGEPTLDHEGTLTALRATQFTAVSASATTVAAGEQVTFEPTVQRADWDTRSWKTFDAGWTAYDIQFRAEGADGWTTVKEKTGGFVELYVNPETSGDYRLKYRGDVVSAPSYSEPIGITVS